MTSAKNARNCTGLPNIRPLGQFVRGQSGMVTAYVDRVTMIYVHISTAAGVEGKGTEVRVVNPGMVQGDTCTNLRFRTLFASLCISHVLGMFYQIPL